MASLRKRPESPKWVCCFTLPDGSRTQRSTGKTDRSEAMAICLEWERASQLAIDGAFTEAQARRVVSLISERAGLGAIRFTTVREFLTDWLRSKTVTKSKGTARRYKSPIADFLTHLGDRADINVSGLVPRDIESFRDSEIKAGKSNVTANMNVKTLRIALNVARKQGLILSNPTEAVDMLPADRQTRKNFTHQQVRQILAVADEEWRGMVLFGACHGLRMGDAARLTWTDINAERRSVTFSPQKTSGGNRQKKEELPLHPDVLDYLDNLPVRSNDPKAPIFPRLFKKKLNGRTGLSLTFRELMHKAGIFTEGEAADRRPGKGRRVFELGFHSLRHTAISEMANAGVSKEQRMKLSGHKSAVHERYTHHELETLRGEVEKIQSFVQPIAE